MTAPQQQDLVEYLIGVYRQADPDDMVSRLHIDTGEETPR